jgi:TetR/AcrR family transcriptional regulator, transcriptional repressor for nem operon
MDYAIHSYTGFWIVKSIPGRVEFVGTTTAEPTTPKGRATRDRIVAAAAELFYRQGVARTSLPDVRAAAAVSSSQIYHYFKDKNALTLAVISYQTEAILAGHSPLLIELDTLDGLRAWRDFVVDSQQQCMAGCPLGSLSSELADHDQDAREAVAAAFTRWAAALRAGIVKMIDNGRLRLDTDAGHLADALLAALQGGLLLTQAQHTTTALEAGLDTVIDCIARHSTADKPRQERG